MQISTFGDVSDRDEDPVGLVACVVDEDPRFHFEALRWYAGLTRLAGVDPSHLVVHAIRGSEASPQLRYLRHEGVSIRSVDPFDARHPPCNKISGAVALAESKPNGVVVLTDTDLALLEDPRVIPIGTDSIASRVVFHPTPPNEVLISVFEEARLPLPRLVPLEWPKGAFTIAGNGNGGLYAIPGVLFHRIARAWEHWAQWLFERLDLFGSVQSRLDQVAMAMAMVSEEVGWVQLEERWNLPLPAFWKNNPDLLPPAGLHYHREVEASGELTLTKVPVVNDRINELNVEILSVFRECLGESHSTPPWTTA